MFSKTVGLLNTSPIAPKGKKAKENASILFGKPHSPFCEHGGIYGKIHFSFGCSLLAWSALLPRGDFISADGFHGCVRDSKKNRHTKIAETNEKSGKPIKAPSMGSLNRLAAFLIA